MVTVPSRQASQTPQLARYTLRRLGRLTLVNGDDLARGGGRTDEFGSAEASYRV
jgi:hypothetical protein